MMRLKLLKDILSEIAGKQAEELAEVLYDKENVNEFKIAKKLKVTINQVRNILYKLSNHNLVSFTRKKEKKKGWYTYFWTLDEEKALVMLDKRLGKKIFSYKNQLKSRQDKTYYICKVCKTEVSEETALENSFVCPECGEVYKLQKGKDREKLLKTKITRLEKERSEVLKELSKIRKKREEKKRKRRKRRKRRKKLSIAEIKGVGKKKAEQFRKKRIKTIGGLLRLKPETVAKKLGISVKKAKKYQKRAKKAGKK